MATITGTSGNDTLTGTTGDDSIVGLEGNDNLDGGDGDDRINGGDGDDFISAGRGHDSVDGGAGNDRLAFSVDSTPFTVSQPAPGLLRLTSAEDGIDVRFDASIENVSFPGELYSFAQLLSFLAVPGSEGSDTLLGSPLADSIEALGGADSVSGAAGDDTLIGNAGNDTLVGGNGNDRLDGGAGNDRLDGGFGSHDRADYSAAPAGVSILLASSNPGTALDGQGGTDTLISVEDATGSAFADSFVGVDNAAYRSFEGLAGNDTLDGGARAAEADYTHSTLRGAVASLLDGRADDDGHGGVDTLLRMGALRGSELFGDHLTGDDAGNDLYGQGGNDTLVALAGNDYLEPGTGVDFVDGGRGSDDVILNGPRSAFTVSVLANGDVRLLSPSTAEDVTLRNVETMYFARGAEDFELGELVSGTVNVGTPYAERLRPDGIASHTIDAGAGDDIIDASSGSDTILGGPGDDRIQPGTGVDSVDGGSGYDRMNILFASTEYQISFPGDGAIRIFSALRNVDVTASGVEEISFSNGEFSFGRLATGADSPSAFADRLATGAGNDSVDGLAGDDSLAGHDGDDSLAGSAGDDTLDGGPGNDSLLAGSGSDWIDGGSGTDLAVLGGSRVDWLVQDLGHGEARLHSASLARTTFIGRIENLRFDDGEVTFATLIADAGVTLVGDAGANSLAGGNGDDSIDGLGGNDTLAGGAGDDTLLGGAGQDGLYPGTGNDSIDGGATLDLVGLTDGNLLLYGDLGAIGVDVDMRGTSLTDPSSFGTVSKGPAGSAGTDRVLNVFFFELTDGDDIFHGSAATREQVNAGAGSDTLDGGAIEPVLLPNNSNRLAFVQASGPVTADLQAGSASGGSGDKLFSHFNQLRGGPFADLLLGSDDALRLEELDGGANGGDDTLDGRGGTDAVRFEAAESGTSGVDVDLASGIAHDGRGGTDTLRNIEWVRGSRWADTLLGSDNSDVTEYFHGRGGNDTIDGRGGFDIVLYLFAASAVNVTLAHAGSSSASDGNGDTDTLSNVEGVWGSDFADAITGSEAANRLLGAAGDDTLEGLGGNDELDGGSGDDRLVPGSGSDTVDGHSGHDTVVLGYPRAEASVVHDGALFTLTRGSDTLRLFEVETVQFSDMLVPAAELQTTGVTLVGGAVDDILEGTSAADSLSGLDGFDIIHGGGGDDTLDGGAGVDDLLPGPGNDLVIGGDGDDIVGYSDLSAGVIVDLAQQRSTKLGGAGTDTLVSIERAAGSPFADRLIGDAADNTFYASGGSDTFEGSAGNDIVDYLGNTPTGPGLVAVLPADALTAGSVADGRGGTDVLMPGSAEQFFGSRNADLITGAPRTTVDELVLGNDLIVAFDGDDTVLGLSGDDALIGGLGNDHLDGGLGNDSLQGDDGNDVLLPGSGRDTIEAGAGDDLVVLGTERGAWHVQVQGADLLLTLGAGDSVVLRSVEMVQFSDQSLSASALAANVGRTLDGTDGPDTLVALEGNDSLRGLGGNDRLDGGPGNDSLDGGTGSYDWLTGGAGNDTLDGGATAEGSFGVDIVIYEGSAAVAANLQTGTASQSSFTDTLIRIGAVFSGSGEDSLRGADGEATQRGETLRGGAGNDSIDGGTGVDAAEWLGSPNQYTLAKIDASTWTVTDNDTSNGNEGTDHITNIERLVFSDQMLSLGTRAEEVARVAFILWSPGIIVSTALFARGMSFYDVGYDFTTLCATALQFWTGERDAQLVQRLLDNSGSTRTPAEMLQVIIDNGGAESIAGRATAVAQIALDAATTGLIEQSGIRVTGLLSDNIVPGFGTLFSLLPDG